MSDAQLMKGHTWKARRSKMTYPAWVEIKHDEIRCHVQITLGDEPSVSYLSYAGKPLFNLGLFDQCWIELARTTGHLEFDTGFEANGTYNDSYRWVRSKNGLPDDLLKAPAHFLLFDIPNSSQPFEQRMTIRHSLACCAASTNNPTAFDERLWLFQPAGSWAHEEESVEKMFTVARERGFEGLMVKSLGHLYERGKRTSGWLKVKPEDDADGVIVELIRAVSIEGVPLNRVGSVRIRMEDGSEACPHGLEHALGEDMWYNPEKYMGQWAEFRYMERDRQGGYRHPVWHRLREEKA